MERAEVINQIIEKKNAKNYLEIGVFNGDCFRKIRAQRKIAVDPIFRFSWDERKDTIKKRVVKALFDKFDVYYAKTSDAFFKEDNALVKKYPLDVVFIDGLHTYEQTMKDVANSLEYLKEDGVIVLHDCNPQSETIGYPAASLDDARSKNLPDWQNVWSGDVWKTIATLRATRDDLSTFVLDTDTGLGIIRRAKSKKITALSDSDLKNLTYSTLEAHRNELLGVEPLSYLPAFIASL